jgi:hypothetical protein
VTQLLGFGDSELAVEAQLLGPGVKILGAQNELHPGFVADEVLAGQVAQPGVLGGADAVLDVGPVTVPQLEGGERMSRFVLKFGGDPGLAQAV